MKRDCDLTCSGAGDDGGKEPICNKEVRVYVCEFLHVPLCVRVCVVGSH